MRRQKGNITFGDGGNFMPIDYDDTIFDDYNPCPVSVMFAKGKEQAQREGGGRCIYPEFPDSRRVYSAMAALDDSLCITKTTGWEREICVRKADVSRIIELLYQDSVKNWDYMTIINQIDGDFVWIIGYGD